MKNYNGYEEEKGLKNREEYSDSLVTDDYEHKMGQAAFLLGKHNDEVVFDVFFREIPNGGGYAVMAGLDDVIKFIKDFKFTETDLAYLKDTCGYTEEYINYLRNYKFTGDIYAIPDGTPVFPNEPIITVKSSIVGADVIETALLAIVNGAISHATAARRIVEAAQGRVVMEFGARRADGLGAAVESSIWALMAGCGSTSNLKAGATTNKRASGTMAHSWVQLFDSEEEAFEAFAKIYPNNCILLVDTYNVLKSGVPNAIKTFQKMKENNISLDNIGIRIDSGDLAYLTVEARKMLDEAGFPQTKICMSNGLNAETIESLISQGACFDSLGVGDNISKPDGRMGCVYKLVAVYKNGEWIPKIKLSESSIKITNPGYKKLYRVFDKKSGYALCDVMTGRDEVLDTNSITVVSVTDYINTATITDFELVELQKPIFIDGQLVYDRPSFEEMKEHCNVQMNKIYPETRRTKNPQKYWVDGTSDYVDYKKKIASKARTLQLGK